MPTLQENKAFWDGMYKWEEGGDEWSRAWGGPRTQWYGTIFPRIHAFVPAQTILEIACGYGRWTYFLKDFCKNLIAVDISEECILACKSRFAQNSNISFYLNNGKSLDMASDHSVDFVFSMDSLVHADEAVLRAYLHEISRILTKDGAAFLHHSNLGEYSSFLRMTQKLGIKTWLMSLGYLEKNYHWRDENVTAKKVAMYAEEFNLQCISQETINWGTKRTLIDCLSTIVRKDSVFVRENRVLRNPLFGNEIRRISNLYNFSKKDNSGD